MNGSSDAKILIIFIIIYISLLTMIYLFYTLATKIILIKENSILLNITSEGSQWSGQIFSN